jgi:ABC-type amino acid transport substrate-binding protein
MKLSQILAVVALSVLLSIAGASYLGRVAQPSSSAPESRWEHIKKTGVLRCGYIVWPPFVAKDMKNGQMKGLFVDLMERIGKELSIKIDWSGEAIMGQMFTDLNNKRYDAICAPFFATPGRAREGSFTVPVFYHPAYLYARADDHRFDGNYDAANNDAITFAAVDGDFSSLAPQQIFTKAKRLDLPQLSTGADLYMQLVNKKADLVAQEPFSFADFDKGNKGLLRQVSGAPLQVSPVSIPLPAREGDLKEVMDVTLTYLHDNGFIEGLFKKYEESEGMKFLRQAKPYTER